MKSSSIAKGMALYNQHGQRLYLNPSERQRFIDAALDAPPLQRTFCLMLLHTGCRISEARYLRKGDLQLCEQLVSINTLKRRDINVVREVPIPQPFAQLLELAHFNTRSPLGPFLWSASNRPPPRSSVYRWVKEIMSIAGIDGPQACPKGLRHSFGVHATRQKVQLHMIQKWMGHADIETTSIYATAFGPEELEVASRMWSEEATMRLSARHRSFIVSC